MAARKVTDCPTGAKDEACSLGACLEAPLPDLRSVLLLVLLLAVGCTPIRGGSNGRSGDDAASATGDDDDDATADDDDATGDDDDDATGDDDDDATGDDDDATGGDDALADDVWAADIANGTWVQPSGVGPLFASFFAGQWLLFDVVPAPTSNFNSGAVHVVLGTGTGESSTVEQDLCVTTSRPTAGNDGNWGTGDDDPAAWGQPQLTLGPADIGFGSDGMPIGDATMTAVFNSQFSSFSGGTLAGEIDARDLEGMIGSTPQEICDLFQQTAGVQCEPCSDGQVLCIPIEIEDLTGFPVFSAPMEERTEADVASDPNCN